MATPNGDDRRPASDGQRWAPAMGLPLDPSWRCSSNGSWPFRKLLTLPSVHRVLEEVLGDDRWGNALPSVPAGLRKMYRLDHDYVNFTPPFRPELTPGAAPRIPPPNPPGLHGSVTSYHVTVVFELRDVLPGDGGFGCLDGSHRASYSRPTHEGWTLPPFDPGFVTVVPANQGDAIIFSEKLSHSTVPWASTERERRSVFYKFVPYGQHNADKRYNWLEPTLTTEESERLALPAWWFNTEADKQPCEPYPRM
jgi:hypothetical protein